MTPRQELIKAIKDGKKYERFITQLRITWVDSERDSHWFTSPDVDCIIANEDSMAINTIGFFVGENDKCIVITHTCHPEEGSILGYLKIPKCAITDIEVIK